MEENSTPAGGFLTLKTKRLDLIAGTAELVRAHLGDPERLALLLDVRVPRLSPPPSETQEVMELMAQALEKRPEQAGWWCWYFVLHNRVTGHRVMIGDGGFKGPPDADGTVELGYSLLQPYWNRGYATEAVKALLEWAFDSPDVRGVFAEAQLGNTASIRVLQKAGFNEVGPGSERSVMRFEIGRQDLPASVSSVQRS
ncbi:MAG TPA: GNAT family N-acetyltransferase [Anaerolineae bacterium]|nr:GNAT family N-acetyltransferase [Anaerolineae bacterium]